MEEKQVTETLSQWEDEPLLPDENASDAQTETDGASDTEATNPDVKTENPEETAPESQPEDASKAEPEPDYKSLYEGMRERENAEKFRRVFNEQLSLTGNEAVARMVAQNECGGKTYPLETPDAPNDKPDFSNALSELTKLYPDASEMPKAVMEQYMNGTPLKDAYAAHRAAEDRKTIANLRAEVAALKKTASNRDAAPVKGTAGAAPEKEDLYLKGFDSDQW